MTEGLNQTYMPVDAATVELGMLMDRPLYVYLEKNSRYICIIHAYQPVEQSHLDKIAKTSGKLFTSEVTVEEKLPLLKESVARVKELCESDDAPFEKNRALREATLWLQPHVLGPSTNTLATVFFFKRAFDVPRAATLQHVSDFSVEAQERCLKFAATAGLFALWLGYSSPAFLLQFVESLFCRELTAQEAVPGTSKQDHRFRKLVEIGDNFKATTDELNEVVAFTRWVLTRKRGETVAPSLRVTRKLSKLFAHAFAVEDEKQRQEEEAKQKSGVAA